MASDDKYGRHLEKRAEELGLPTDPAAYQDGGMVPAATAGNLPEAEVLAAVLKANDVPAWVDFPLSALYAQGYQRPRIAVLVPLGRLPDARRLIAEHPPKVGPPEEEGQVPEEAEEEPVEPAKPAARRSPARIAASLIILGFGILEAIVTLSGTLLDKDPWGPDKSMALGFCGLIAVVACAIGIRGLRRPRESRP